MILDNDSLWLFYDQDERALVKLDEAEPVPVGYYNLIVVLTDDNQKYG